MIRLLIVDDHPIVRQGLATALAKAPEVRIVGEASDGDDALEKARSLRPDLILLDIGLPGKNGFEVLKLLQAEMSSIRVLILSAFPEKQYAVRCMANGAKGYLTKRSASEELVLAVRKVMQGGRYVSASLADLLADEIGVDTTRPPHEVLSDREFQVLCLLGEGKTLSETAVILSLSVSTVNTHRARTLEKLRLKSTAQLIRYAVENSLADTSR